MGGFLLGWKLPAIYTVDIDGILASANRDLVIGFTSGSGGDIIAIDDVDTTAGTTTANPPAIQEINSLTGNQTFITTANDILEFSVNIAGTGLGDGSANSLNGTNLLAAVGTVNVSADQNTGYIVAYQGGNAYVYHVAESNDGGVAVAAADIQLVATLTGVAVGSLEASNFTLV